MSRHEDITGQKFGRLTALYYLGSGKWLCRCECGNQSTPLVASMKKGLSQSCGCLHRERRTKHGMHKDRVYRVWTSMRARCRNPNDSSFHNYGGRGIKVCERWDKSFSNFVADMGTRPRGFDIDRIDNDKDYCPENCRWISRRQNLLNTRITRMITFNGETLPMRVWAERYGLKHTTLKYRIDSGVPVELALTASPHKAGRRKAAEISRKGKQPILKE